MLYFDIETVPCRSSWEKLDDNQQRVWTAKYAKKYPDLSPKESFEQKAGIHAEFGRVVCVTIGTPHKGKFYMKSFAGNHELGLLNATALAIEGYEKLCGHNIKGFDIPWLCRRMMVNRIMLPPPLQVLGKKPWEIKHEDTMEMWKFGGWDNVSLDALCMVLGVPTPKDAIDGSQVAEYFYSGRIAEIVDYCHKDVFATADCHSVLTTNQRLGLEIEHHVKYFNYGEIDKKEQQGPVGQEA